MKPYSTHEQVQGPNPTDCEAAIIIDYIQKYSEVVLVMTQTLIIVFIRLSNKAV